MSAMLKTTGVPIVGYSMLKMLWKISFGLLTLLILVACGSPRNKASFIDQLRGRGLSVTRLGNTAFPPGPAVSLRTTRPDIAFLQPALEGERLGLSGKVIPEQAEVEMYDASESRIQFNSDGTALTVRGPSGDQSIDLHHVPVVPHMFLNNQVLVFYFSDDKTVLNLLKELLGPPVAGSETLHRLIPTPAPG